MATNVIARSSSTGAILLSWDPVGSVQPSGYRILIQADGAGPYRERPEDREARGSDTCVVFWYCGVTDVLLLMQAL